eukprot:5542626-Pyramimonas_sp.AAC.2
MQETLEKRVLGLSDIDATCMSEVDSWVCAARRIIALAPKGSLVAAFLSDPYVLLPWYINRIRPTATPALSETSFPSSEHTASGFISMS